MIDYLSITLYGVSLVYIGSKLFSYFGWYFRTLNEAVLFTASSPIPTVTIYSHRGSMIFWLASPWLVPIFEKLPFGWGHWFKYVRMDFAWWYRDLHRRELKSDLFWTAGPGGPGLLVSDAAVISEICHRWKDFSKHTEKYVTLAVFGQNVVTTEGSTWQKHRKITGPPFNERNSRLVFADSVAQGRAMLASFTSDAEGHKSSPGQEPVVEDLLHWTMTVTLHILSSAAFSLKMPWPTKSVLAPSAQSSEATASQPVFQVTEKHTMSFQQSLDALMDCLAFIILFPPWLLRNAPLAIIRNMQRSADEFRTYLSELIADNRHGDNAGRGDLLGSIVRASSADQKSTWTEEDTIGNIFVFVLAGHETTASTLQSALILLACHPDFQQQIQSELDEIWSTKKPGEDWTYEDYPKMRHIMALMLETLRKYPAVNILPKRNSEAQTLTYCNQTIYIPADTEISLQIISVQHNPLYWGEDAYTFRPSRWLMLPSYTPPPNSSNESPAHENLFCPPKGAFLAFSAGFRACLGKKFAQVEFCTLVAVLLKECSVELVREGEERWEEARDRALGMMYDRISGIAMRMRGKVKVRFVRRGCEGFPVR